MKSLHVATLLLCFLLPACAERPEAIPKKKVESQKAQLVGRVASIPAKHNFVLIQSYGSWNVATGSILTTQGTDGRAANLLITGEKLGQYAAADVQSGRLKIGDGVYTLTRAPELFEAPIKKDHIIPSEAATEESP